MPRKRITRLVVCFIGLASTIPLPARAQVWDFMGDAQINSTQDHERIQVTRRNAFQSIQLRVSGDAVFFDHLVLHFGDGTSQEMAVEGRIWPGGKNRLISFSGERRAVESVELWYYKEPWEHSPRVILYGS